MIRSTLLSTAALAALTLPLAAAAPTPTQTLEDATEVLQDLAKRPLKSIPPNLLADAQGVAIFPHVVKAGFIVGGRAGHGVVMSRGKNGTWSNPVFVHIAGASVGLQAGVESSDVVLLFRSRKSLDRILEGKGKVTLGADASIAAGPVGRQVGAGTDGQLQAEIMSYSRSRGLFAGLALDGAAITNDRDANAIAARETRVLGNDPADLLRAHLTQMSSPQATSPAPAILTPPVAPRSPR